jgi:hypothetical protein
MRWVVLILLMIGFVSAVEIDFECPDEIYVDEEFECSLEVYDGNGVYDVKIDLDGERNSVLDTWNDGEWESGYYYLQDFIDDGEERDVKMRVSEIGEYDGVLKLRQGDKREFFDIEIEVEEKEFVNNEELENKSFEKEIVLGNEPGVTVLNERVIYESQDLKVVNYLVYGFCVFLIFVVGILIWERF